jgi:hypothetical protein
MVTLMVAPRIGVSQRPDREPAIGVLSKGVRDVAHASGRSGGEVQDDEVDLRHPHQANSLPTAGWSEETVTPVRSEEHEVAGVLGEDREDLFAYAAATNDRGAGNIGGHGLCQATDHRRDLLHSLRLQTCPRHARHHDRRPWPRHDRDDREPRSVVSSRADRTLERHE